MPAADLPPERSMRSERMRSAVMLVVFICISFGVASLGSLATQSALTDWYPTLDKSVLNPPNVAFPIAWTVLFTLMAIAIWLVWRRRNTHHDAADIRRAMLLFFVQLLFNLGWSVAFFGMQSPVAGLVVIVPFLLLIVAMAQCYRRVSVTAFWLTVPYMLWVAFAGYLNLAVAWLN